MRRRSPANSADSSPPSPALISKITSLASLGSRGISSSASRSSIPGIFASSSAASAAKPASSAASSSAAVRSARACSSSAAVLAIGDSSANRRPVRRASAWSAWIDGSASRCSSSAYSASSVARRCPLSAEGIPLFLLRQAPASFSTKKTRAPEASLLGGLLGLDLGVLLLELGHPAGGVEHALLAGVERVADVARLDVDLPVLGGAAGGELVTAGAGDLGLYILRVDVGLHRSSVLSNVVAGSPACRVDGVNRNLAVAQCTEHR